MPNTGKPAYNRKVHLTEKELTELYVNQKLSTVEIGKLIGVTHGTILKWLIRYDIPRRPAGFQTNNTLGTVNKNRSYDAVTRKEISNTLKHHYKNPEFKQTHGFQDGHEYLGNGSTMFEKGIIPWNKDKTGVYSEETIRQMREGGITHSFPPDQYPTKIEQKFIELIQKYKLPLKYTGNGSFWIDCYNPDFIHTQEQKIAVEIFGEYWHNPKLNKTIRYNATEEGRTQIFNDLGWQLIIFWDKDLKDEHLILSTLQKYNIEGTE